MRAAVRAGVADLAPGDRVLVALSGGADSLALLSAATRVCAEVGLIPGAIVIDHGLQPGSDEVAANAAERAALLGCADVSVVRVDVARGPGAGGPEAAARAARYAALEAEAGKRTREGVRAVVLLGHTRDDQAETVLLGLARGSGLRSVAGMPRQSGLFRRPLLGLSRALVARAAAADAQADPRLAPWADPHNDDPAFARVRVRREVLPVLERALGPGIPEALARTAALAREDADALDAWADRVWASLVGPVPGAGSVGGAAREQSASAAAADRGQEDPVEAGIPGVGAPGVGAGAADLPTSALVGPDAPPPAVLSRVVRRLLLAAGCPPAALTMEHVQAVRGLLGPAGGSAEVALPGGVRARREGDHLVVRA